MLNVEWTRTQVTQHSTFNIPVNLLVRIRHPRNRHHLHPPPRIARACGGLGSVAERAAGISSTGTAFGMSRADQYAAPSGELATIAAAPARATALRSHVLTNPVYSGGLFGSRITHGVRVSMAATPPAISLSTYHVVSTSGRHERRMPTSSRRRRGSRWRRARSFRSGSPSARHAAHPSLT